MQTDLDLRLDEAIAHYQKGDLTTAASCFDDILRQAPDHPVALRLRGLTMVRVGDVAAALPLLARARRLAPHEPLTHLHYGIGLQQAGHHARAAALFRRAAMLMPDNPASWTNFSAALLSLGRGKAARAAARRAVKLAPRSAECWHALGLAQRAEGNIAGSRDAFARAVRLDRSLPQVWVDLGLAWYQLGDFADAQQAMREAIAIQPDCAPAQANLAAFLLLRGDADAALDMLRDLLRRDPGFAAARLNLANALLLENQAGEALALLEGEPPAGRDGRHWHAHRAMALLMLGRRDAARCELDAIAEPYGDAEILVLWRRIVLLRRDGDDAAADTLAERMAALVEDEPAALLEHRIIACFDLARFHHQRGRKDAAMDHWQRGHRLLARLQPFSRDTFHAFVDTSIARYDAARLRRGPRAANADTAPVFIVGLPRSGTSLTEQILASHAQIFGAGERPALHRLLHELVDGAETAEAASRAAALDTTVLTGAAERYLEALHALSPGATFVLDKMPGNARHLGFIATLLPGARIIQCRRDPRDIGLSIFQHRFFGHHPYAHDLADLGWAIGQQERLMAHWRGVLPLPMIEVALADWVDDFSGTLARLLDFLGLPHDPACERFYLQERRVRTASALQVRQPINARGLGRWRTYEAQLAPMMAELRQAGLLGR
jgi:tetratricopeptide (TPR) repeat protein